MSRTNGAYSHVIETEGKNDRYVSELESLHDRGDLTAEEDLLSISFED
jgi:hypothetical protein